ncbi:MFS transporter [Sporosarcina sp. P12(2017)]|uniref:MFS transporter n=1 Tax=unclassified Sporosarcina TaxID=2647733 RepID=UPI000C170DE1|nr:MULTISPECIES: MFS transporter [unclassified Sporosarcina]PIC57998.1 MFS transporter [Sporosarcina sp. P10]PIC61381.1 MFS transporter [Sporosarcina sp. P12(2017)]
MKLNRNFNLLLTGQSLANIGDVLYIVCIIYFIFELTGSATAADFVPFTITSAMFISNALTPLLIQRFNLKWLLAGSQIGKTILLVALTFFLQQLSLSNFYWLFLIIFLVALLDGCTNPVTQSLIPNYVKSEQLLKANGITETVTQLIQTSIWLIGSSLLIWLSASAFVWLTVGAFSVSSLLFTRLEAVQFTPTKEKYTWQQISRGWQTVFTSPVLKRIVWMDILETIAGTVWIAAILYVFVSDALVADEKWWGFINGAFFIGLMSGSLICLRFPNWIEPKLGQFIILGSFSSGLLTIFFGLTSIPTLSLIISFLVGVSGQVKNIPQQTVVQTSVPKDRLPTVFTTLGAIGTGTFGVASLLTGVLADAFGIRGVYILSGLLLLVVGVIAYKGRVLLSRKV